MIENKLSSIENGFNVFIVSSVISKIMASNKSSANKSNCCLVTIGLVSFLFAFVFGLASIFGFFILPNLINNRLIESMILAPDSPSYNTWKKPDIPIYTYYYLFNITNVDQLYATEDKPLGEKPFLQEIGPYVFRQILEKINVTFNDEMNTVQYREVKRWILDPVKTKAPLDAEIFHVNVPLVV